MFTLHPLPFNQEALAPYISAKTLEFHYGRHHQAYVDNLNKLIIGSELADMTLEEIIMKTVNDPDKTAIFNNAGQVYNHDFFWQSLRPANFAVQVGEKTQVLINKSFGSLENFYNEFKTIALGQFGSGWTWLVKEEAGLKIVKTANAQNPLVKGLKPLFCLDVWEHAYYLDYQNKRADFIGAVLQNLINWNFIETNL